MSQSNYSGITGVHFNPAFMADTRYKVNINLFAVNVYAQNNYYNFKTPYTQWQVARGKVDSLYLDINGTPIFTTDNLEKNRSDKRKYVYFSTDIKGPSAIMPLNDVSSFAISTRLRANAHLANLNTNVIEFYMGDNDTTTNDTSKLGDSFKGNRSAINTDLCANAFQQFTASYSRVLKDEDHHFLTGGVSVSYLIGAGAAYLKVNKLNYESINDDTAAVYNADIDYGFVKPSFYTRHPQPDLYNYYDDIAGRGMSLDIGLNYERRVPKKEYFYEMDGKIYEDKSMRKYIYRLGASVVDLGKINYKNASYVKRINIKGDDPTYFVEEDFKQLARFHNTHEADSFLYTFYPESDSGSQFKIKLPAALNFIADFRVANNFYVGGQYTQNIRLKKAIGVRAQNVLYFSARYETRKFEASFSLLFGNFYRKMQSGLFLRSGPFFIGTDNLGGLVNTSSTNGFNLYTGFSILIPHKRLKDGDEDLISDKLDKCPDVKGGTKTAGCPDKDSDEVPDKEDECPNLAGSKRSNGCPDEDGDKVWSKADKCPDKPGTKANAGCPDTDGDGIYDHKDDCPTVAGIKGNKGCPSKVVDVKKTDPPPKPVKKEETPLDFNTYYYYPVVGAFGVKTNADNFSKSFTGKTKVKTILVYNAEKKIYYVSTGKLSTKEEATAIIENLGSPEINSFINGTMWMYAIPR